MEQQEENLLSGCAAAVRRVLHEMTDLEIMAEGWLPQSDIFSSAGLAVIIGVTGKYQGRVILDMAAATAQKVSAVMNAADEDEAGDQELILDTIAELANILAGHIITHLNNSRPGMRLMLTPPSVFAGSDLKIIAPKTAAQVAVFNTPLGYLALSIGLERGDELWTPS